MNVDYYFTSTIIFLGLLLYILFISFSKYLLQAKSTL